MKTDPIHFEEAQERQAGKAGVTPAVYAEPDPTEGLPLFINATSPETDEAIERLFVQETGG